MKKLLMFLIIILLACPLYAQQELDSDTSGSVDAEIGGTNQDTWAAGEIPYCSAATGAAGDGELDGIPNFIYSTVTSRLECTQANPPYFENGINIGDANDAKWTFLDTQCPGTDKEIGYIQINYLDGADGAENGEVLIYAMEAGTETLKLHSGAVSLITSNGSITLTKAQMGSTVYVTATGEVTLPDVCDAATGYHVWVYTGAAATVDISTTDTSDDIFFSAAQDAVDTQELENDDVINSFVHIICMAANEWLVRERNGAWTSETAD